jgi:DNA replication licensing factor MCM7
MGRVVTSRSLRATSKGYKPDAIDRCLEEYEGLDVWQLNQARTKLTIVNSL